MRTNIIVVATPVLQLNAGLRQRREQGLVQELVAQGR